MSRPLHHLRLRTRTELNFSEREGGQTKPINIPPLPSEANLRSESRWIISLKTVDLQSVPNLIITRTTALTIFACSAQLRKLWHLYVNHGSQTLTQQFAGSFVFKEL